MTFSILLLVALAFLGLRNGLCCFHSVAGYQKCEIFLWNSNPRNSFLMKVVKVEKFLTALPAPVTLADLFSWFCLARYIPWKKKKKVGPS